MSNSSSAPTCSSCGARVTGNFCIKCGARYVPGACSTCKAVIEPGSHFCAQCGTAVTAGAQPGVRAARANDSASKAPTTRGSYIPWGIAAIIFVAVATYFAARDARADPSALAASTDASAAVFASGNTPGAAPDIGNMSPRERASRLYDRIMRYAEAGQRDSLLFFAPMALTSFEMLGAELDADALYDYGRVAAEADKLALADSQATAVLTRSPNHLLGLALAARIAKLRGDAPRANALWKTFLSNRTVELQKNLPEYQMHGSDIEQATKMAQGIK